MIIAKCDCGFEDELENFHLLSYMRKERASDGMFHQDVYIACPRCGDIVFCQHGLEYPIKTRFNMTVSHLLAAPTADYPTHKDAKRYMEDRKKELHLVEIDDIAQKFLHLKLEREHGKEEQET